MPLTLLLQFPAGRYVAASWGDKDTVEWPPHPARLCLALTDVLHRFGNPSDLREALLWLCQQEPPEIVIPADDMAEECLLEGIFVPQNPSVAEAIIKHPRKQRSFPVVFLNPDEPTVFFHWPKSEIPEILREPLSRLLAALPRLGHSSSLVMANASSEPAPSGDAWRVIRPTSADEPGSAEFRLRVGWDGILESAETAYDADGRVEEMEALINTATRSAKPDKPLKPAASPRGRHDPRHRWQGYSEGCETQPSSTLWDRRLLVLEQTGGDRLGLASTWQLAEIFHKAVIERWTRQFGGQAPAWISGHQAGGNGEKTAPTSECHLAIFPLAFVGTEHASGHLLGVGLAFPKPEAVGIDAATLRIEWRQVLSALFSNSDELELSPKDKAWTIRLAVEASPKPRQALVPSRWTRSAKVWSTVTPIILDRHPKPHFKKDPEGWRSSCAAIIADACARIGLPRPTSVVVSPHAQSKGVPPSFAFTAPAARAGRPPRFHIHATLHFAEEVEGPLLLGAGRFRGYGLCLPAQTPNHSLSNE